MATIHGVTKGGTGLSNWAQHTCGHLTRLETHRGQGLSCCLIPSLSPGLAQSRPQYPDRLSNQTYEWASQLHWDFS